MEETKSMICITCPKGCSIEVTTDGNTLVRAKGGCKRGHEFVERELHDPRRMVATTVRMKGALHPLLPVYSSAAFPKLKIPELLIELRKIELEAPIRMGQIVLKDALGSGVDILASRTAESYPEKG